MRYTWLIAVVALMVSLCTPTIAEVNFVACLDDVRSGQWGPTGGTDDYGNLVSNITAATGLTYDMCVRACGAKSESTVWSTFSQQFGSWLLPWLALLSQLPYGANNRFDNLMSMLLTVGSPALAGYSLAFTALNGQWIARCLAHYEQLNPSAKHATRILTVLQQYPLRVYHGDLLTSLATLPENRGWWRGLARRLKYTPKWTISTVTSMAWVVIAFLFTVIDSFTDLSDVSESINRNGQGIGSAWLWLLPIVTGWVKISPECDSARLLRAIRNANARVYVLGDGILFSAPAHSIISVPDDMYDDIYRDERCTIPIYNYARFLPWAETAEAILRVFHGSSGLGRRTPSGANKSTDNLVLDTGVLNRHQIPLEDQTFTQRGSIGGAVLLRLFLASTLGLFLQWGTTGAAIVVQWFTPTYGLGCRSGSNLLYGTLATLVWAMLVLSSILAYHSTRMSPAKHIPRSAHVSRFLSILLRRMGKFIATINAIWLVLTSMFQFSNVFDRCWCNSSVIGLRSTAYTVIDYSHFDLTGMRAAWIYGMILAAATAFIFILSVNFLAPSRARDAVDPGPYFKHWYNSR